MEQSKLKKYAEVKAEIKALEALAKTMEPDVMKEVEDQLEGAREKRYDAGFATFSLLSSKKYQYTPELMQKEALVKEKIKMLKHQEESDGKAVLLQDGYSLRVELKKEK